MEFRKDLILENLEKENNWSGAIVYLTNIWNNDKKNIDSYIRLGTEYWYVLVNWRDCSITNITYDELVKKNIELYEFGKNIFNSDYRFLSIYGYMIHLFPFLFTGSRDDEEELSQNACEMLEQAHKIVPSNEFVSSFYYNTSKETSGRVPITSNIDNELVNSFPGDSAIEKYFKEILHMIFDKRL